MARHDTEIRGLPTGLPSISGDQKCPCPSGAWGISRFFLKGRIIKNPIMKAFALALAAVLVAGCGSDIGKEEMGALVGAGLGGLAGSLIGDGGGRLVAVGVGTMLGAILGSEVGKSLDRADRLAMAQATYTALEYGESGTPVTWTNPDSGHSGDVVPQAAVRRAEGTVCREFMKTVTIAGEKQRAYGTACRQAGGTWRII